MLYLTAYLCSRHSKRTRRACDLLRAGSKGPGHRAWAYDKREDQKDMDHNADRAFCSADRASAYYGLLHQRCRRLFRRIYTDSHHPDDRRTFRPSVYRLVVGWSYEGMGDSRNGRSDAICGTCGNSDRCDYLVVGNRNPITDLYVTEVDENGFMVSKKK